MLKPPKFVSFHGGPLDGQVLQRAKGSRLPRYVDNIGMTLGKKQGDWQMDRVRSGRDGTRHYVLVRQEDEAAYIHTTIYRQWFAAREGTA